MARLGLTNNQTMVTIRPPPNTKSSIPCTPQPPPSSIPPHPSSTQTHPTSTLLLPTRKRRTTTTSTQCRVAHPLPDVAAEAAAARPALTSLLNSVGCEPLLRAQCAVARTGITSLPAPTSDLTLIHDVRTPHAGDVTPSQDMLSFITISISKSASVLQNSHQRSDLLFLLQRNYIIFHYVKCTYSFFLNEE